MTMTMNVSRSRLVHLWLACLVALGFASLAEARSGTDTAKTEAAARKIFDQGVAELESGQLSEARDHLEHAYARAPLPEVLYQLGRLAEKEKDLLAAADLYRRYLATLPEQAQPELRSQLTELIARVRSKASELDVSSEDLGALLSMDGHLVGALPLGTPLLVAAGAHRFQVVKGSQRFETNQLTIPPDQHVQLQLAVAPRYAVLTLSSGIALLIEPASTTAELQAQLDKAVSAVAPESSCFLIEREQTAAAMSKLEPAQRDACARRPACQEQLGRLLDASFVLSLTLQPAKLEGTLFDVSTGVAAGNISVANPSGRIEELPQLMGPALRDLLREVANRGRGTLEVTSTPPGAKVIVAGREVGRTPYTREAFEGPLEVALELDGYAPYRNSVQIKRAEPTTLTATLQENQLPPEPPPVMQPPPPPPAPPPRSRWKLIVGSIGLGGGLLLSGFGISALVAHDQCTAEITMPAKLCDYTYNTRAIGAGLLGAGLALTAAGTGLLISYAR